MKALTGLTHTSGRGYLELDQKLQGGHFIAQITEARNLSSPTPPDKGQAGRTGYIWRASADVSQTTRTDDRPLKPPGANRCYPADTRGHDHIS